MVALSDDIIQNVQTDMQRSGALNGLAPGFSRATYEDFRHFEVLRDAAAPADFRRPKLYTSEELFALVDDKTFCLYESGDLCGLFTIEVMHKRTEIENIESIPGSALQGLVYPLSLGFSHAVAVRTGCDKLVIGQPFLCPSIAVVNDRLGCDISDPQDGDTKIITPDQVTPWENLLVSHERV